MESVMAHVANGLMHFGWALVGQRCTDHCVRPKFNRFALLVGRTSNRLYGLPWNGNDFTRSDMEILWEALDNPNLLQRIVNWMSDRLTNLATSLDQRYGGRLL